MKAIYGIGRLKLARPSCVAVGVFDGFHLGHQAIIKKSVAVAKRKKSRSVILTFFPHPDSVVRSSQKSPLLISLDHRLNLIRSFGVDVCVVVKFSSRFRKIDARKFILDILIKKLNMRDLIVSRNFIFGKDRKGDFGLLKRLSADWHFSLHFQPQVLVNKKPISSTSIRGLIKTGRLKQAAKLLGRRVEVAGTVVGGDSRGRKIGFPTANIDPHHEVIPPKGVYIIEAWLKNRRIPGLANIGFHPTFKKADKEIIEIYLFDFQEDIYGEDLRVVFIKRLRPEIKFKKKSHLISQINRDILKARAYFLP